MKLAACLALGVFATFLGACGGDGGGGNGTCTPAMSALITISASGVSPTAVCVLPGGRVTFRNSDSAPHGIASDVCPDLNLGLIAPSATAAVTFADPQICTFHDAGAPTNTAFQGTIAVNSVPVSGPGY